MRALVTGGSGFIGSHLLESLADGYELLNLDLRPPQRSSVAWKKVDIREELGLRDAIRRFKPDLLFHLAARADTDGRTIEEYDSNTLGTRNVVRACESLESLRHLVFVSTQFVTKPGCCSTTGEFCPMPGKYAESKVIGEKFIRASNLKCRWTIARPTNVWGPRHPRFPLQLWAYLRDRIYVHPSGRDAVRSYAYVENVAQQLIRCVTTRDIDTNRLTFYATDRPSQQLSWLNGFSIALSGYPVRFIPRPVFYCAAIIGSALRRCGVKFPLYLERYWSLTTDYVVPTDATIHSLAGPSVSLETGIERTVAWLRNEYEFRSRYLPRCRG